MEKSSANMQDVETILKSLKKNPDAATLSDIQFEIAYQHFSKQIKT